MEQALIERVERLMQQNVYQWGEKHDDKHTLEAWFNLVEHYSRRYKNALEGSASLESREYFFGLYMAKIIAIAVAAIESQNRKRETQQ